jgi:DNA-binding response OmpR family regulator
MPTVLLAEADRDLCQTDREYLAGHGYQVEAAESGLDCWTKLRRCMPDLLILDLDLLWGGADGVLGIMREHPPLASVPVLLTATPAALSDTTELNDPPIVDYLPKPYTLTALLLSVRSAVIRTERKEPSKRNRIPRYTESFVG